MDGGGRLTEMGTPTAGDLTVAVATCGRPEGLARCLQALAAGSVRPGEVIVVDQAPTAQARAVVVGSRGLAARYVEQPRLGLSASRNLALASATTPLLAVTDDDCAPHEGWVAALAAALARHPVPAAVTGPIVAVGPRPPGAHAVSLRVASAGVDHRGRVLPWHVGSGANFAAHTAVLERHAGWDERLGVGSPGRAAEDTDLLYRIMRAGGTVRWEPGAIVAHEWQTRARRMETRTSYAFGIGALCGLWLRRGDPYAARMLAAYARLHGSQLAGAVRRRDRGRVVEHARAVAAIAPGMVYGLGARPGTPVAGARP
jgi:GT2 family glycosyltransferase